MDDISSVFSPISPFPSPLSFSFSLPSCLSSCSAFSFFSSSTETVVEAWFFDRRTRINRKLTKTRLDTKYGIRFVKALCDYRSINHASHAALSSEATILLVILAPAWFHLVAKFHLLRVGRFSYYRYRLKCVEETLSAVVWIHPPHVNMSYWPALIPNSGIIVISYDIGHTRSIWGAKNYL